MNELGCLVVIVVVLVVQLVLEAWTSSQDTPSSPPISLITPDDVVDFSLRCQGIKEDSSKTGLQKDREIAELWQQLAGMRVRWAGVVDDVSSDFDDIVVRATFRLVRNTAKYSLRVFLEYWPDAAGSLVNYHKQQKIWLDAVIPDDAMRELQKAVDHAITLPGRISPRAE